MDNFYEQFVGTGESFLFKFAKFAVYFLGIVSALYLFTGNFIFFVVAALGAVACYFGKKQLYIEYEYIYTNGAVDIDKILDKNKRKRAVTFNISEIELLAPFESDDIKNSNFRADNKFDFYPEKNGDKKYSVLLVKGGQKIQVNFVPNENLLKLCFTKNPRRVKL